MRNFEVVKLPVQGYKERSDSPLPALAVIPARSYREACQRFVRYNAYLASTTIWRVREVYRG